MSQFSVMNPIMNDIVNDKGHDVLHAWAKLVKEQLC